MTEALQIELLHGAQIARIRNNLAQLRIEVFREFPYLYEGTLEYERAYLQTYINAPQSLCVAVWRADELVGASTGLPLRCEEEAFQKPFQRAGFLIDTVFYFGESIVIGELRGQGLGKRFFELREAHARQIEGIHTTAFCAVQRPADHPLRPADDRPLDAFWTQRGYTPRADLTTTYTWQGVDEDTPSPKTMLFWLKTLHEP